MGHVFKYIRWNRVFSLVGSESVAPDIPGVYAYGSVSQERGLPTRIEWVYVGKAKSISARLRQHAALTEKNVALRDWLRSPVGGAEVWYAAVPLELLSATEITLVRRLRPRFNTIKYRGGMQ